MNGRISTRAAARRVGVCTITILRWIRSGLLPAVRVNRYAYWIDPADLERICPPPAHHDQNNTQEARNGCV